MRRERLRLYTESSGPLYFGRIDQEDGRVLHIGRHEIADRENDLLAINWRAPAAQPFYTATPASDTASCAAAGSRSRSARSRASSTRRWRPARATRR